MKNKVLISSVVIAMSVNLAFAKSGSEANSLIKGNDKEQADYKEKKYAEKQNKYLGVKGGAGNSLTEDVVSPSVSLLDVKILESNPHYSNESFWNEKDSSKVIYNETAKISLSDAAFNAIKGFAQSAESAFNSTSQDVSDDKGKQFNPPKTALVSTDHHHKYSEIESQHTGKYNPYKITRIIDGNSVVFDIDGRNWVEDSFGRTILSTSISLHSKDVVSFVDNISSVNVFLADYFFETLEEIGIDELKIKVLNENQEELISGEFPFVLRDVCLIENKTGDSLVARMKVSSVTYNIENIDIFSGMNCGG